MEKKFVIYWDEVYDNPCTSKVVELNFFTSTNGFDIEEKNAVQRIDVSETTPMDNNHVLVMRVK